MMRPTRQVKFCNPGTGIGEPMNIRLRYCVDGRHEHPVTYGFVSYRAIRIAQFHIVNRLVKSRLLPEWLLTDAIAY